MANTITYATALTTIIDFAKANGFEDADALAKVEKLRDQKATRKGVNGKSDARKANEETAREVADKMRALGIDTIRAAWVRENIANVNTVPKAVAILNAATEEGILVAEKVEKSKTRNELVYHLPQN